VHGESIISCIIKYGYEARWLQNNRQEDEFYMNRWNGKGHLG